jgi:hypothetical protein
LSHAHPQAIIDQHLELLDVVDRLAAHGRVRATGVVTDHAAQRTVRMRGRVGGEREVVLLRGLVHSIANYAELDRRCPPGGVKRHDTVEIFGEINDDSNVAALPSETGATAAPHNGHTALPAGLHGRYDVVERTRNDHAHRHLPVHGQVGGIERATILVESDFPCNSPFSSYFQVESPAIGVLGFNRLGRMAPYTACHIRSSSCNVSA